MIFYNSAAYLIFKEQKYTLKGNFQTDLRNNNHVEGTFLALNSRKVYFFLSFKMPGIMTEIDEHKN